MAGGLAMLENKEERGRDFAMLVHQVIIDERRHSVKVVARAMGLSEHAFYARTANRVPFTADEIRRLMTAAPDPRFAAYLLRGTPYVAADRPSETTETPEEHIHWGATRLVIEATDVLESVETALRDGRIDHRDALLLRKEIEIAERAIASLRTLVRRVAPSSAEI